MKFTARTGEFGSSIFLSMAVVASVKVAPLFLSETVVGLVLPPFLGSLVATKLIALLRPSLDPFLRRAIALLVGETVWLMADALRADAIPMGMTVDILAGFALAALLVWRPSRVLLRALIGGVALAAAAAIYLAFAAPGWDLNTGEEALHAVMRLTILLFAVAALRTVNREREDACFEDELFS